MRDELRMTVSRAKALLEKHDAELAMGQWGPNQANPKGYCPIGLYVLDKLGPQPPSTDDYWEFTKNIDKMDYNAGELNLAVSQKIADLVGVPVNYIIGLNNGFEKSDSMMEVVFDDESSPTPISELPIDYVVGFADGRMLLTSLYL